MVPSVGKKSIQFRRMLCAACTVFVRPLSQQPPSRRENNLTLDAVPTFRSSFGELFFVPSQES